MSAIETISRFKLPLMIAEGLFSALALVAVAQLRDGDIVRLDEPLPLLFLVSATGAAFCFFPLCYWSWFRRPDSSIWRWPRVIFYWVLLAGALVGWANFMAVAWSNA